LQNGGIIAYVTDTVWGVGCLPNNKEGVDKIYELKHRDTSKPLILMSDKKENLFPYIKNICPKANEYMEKFFPGALTLVFEKSDVTPNYVTSQKETVGIRVPDNKIFQKLCGIIEGNVLATTSANISGQTPAMNYKEAVEKIGKLVDIVIEDEYEQATGEPSTVAMVTEEKTTIFRQGKIEL
ncbi:MAG: L-threonylcarbamoyladenylate synthase, partial [bacterium]|nr:L-threonylcarbamoyladenylate synthase [bacterium]